jgi:hypothetical protein
MSNYLASAFALLLAATCNPAIAGETSPAPAKTTSAAADTLPATTTSAITVESLKSGPYRPDAMDFAQAAMPEKPFSEMMAGSIERGFREGLGDGASTLEKASPGIMAELEAAVRDATAAMRANAYKDVLQRYARLYSRTFTPAETTELAQFYRTATGRKLIAAKYATLQSSPIDLDRDTTDQDVKAINREAVGSVMSQMDGADMVELTKFGAMPAFRKLKTLLVTVNQLEAAMANEESPEAEKAIAEAIDVVMKRRGFGD